MKTFLLFFFLCLTLVCSSQKVIIINKNNNIYKINCKVDGIPMDFIFDTGASDVSISMTEANFLIKQGLITGEDVKSKKYYQVANGNIEEGTVVVLKEVVVGGILLKNIQASVINNSKAPLLFGLNAINKLGKIVIQNDKIFIYPNQQYFDFTKELNINSQIDSLTNLIKDSPKKFENYYLRAELEIQLEKYKEALEDLNLVIENNSNNSNFLFRRAKINEYLKNFRWALSDFNHIIELDSNYNDIYKERGICKYYLKLYPNAIEDLDKAIKINQRDTVAFYFRGFSKTNINISEALIDINNAINLNSKYKEALYLRIGIQFGLKNFVDAKRDIDFLIQIYPNDIRSYASRGEFYVYNNELQNALNDFNIIIEMDSTKSYPYARKGFIKKSLGDKIGALKDFNKAIELDSKAADNYYERGLIEVSMSNKELACADFSKAGELGYKDAYNAIKKYCQ